MMELDSFEQIEWDHGHIHRYGWIILVIWLTLGTLLNACQLLIHVLIPELRKQRVYPIIIWLATFDFLFDLFCLIQCSLNLKLNRFYGDENGCLLQAFYAELLMSLSGFSIFMIFYSCYYAIKYTRHMSSFQIHVYHAAAIAYCTFLALLGAVYPGRGALNSSGLFCYTASQYVAEGVVFHIGYVLPMLIAILWCWHAIISAVNHMKKLLMERGMAKILPRQKEVTNAWRMIWYVIALFCCLVPYEVAVFWMWISQRHPPYQVWVTFGVFGHSLTMFAPLLYYLLNKTARRIVSKAFRCREIGRACRRALCICFTCDGCRRHCPIDDGEDQSDYFFRDGENGTIVSAPTKVLQGHTNAGVLRLILQDREAFEKFIKFARARQCEEALLFIKDVDTWKEMVRNVSPIAPQRRARRDSESQESVGPPSPAMTSIPELQELSGSGLAIPESPDIGAIATAYVRHTQTGASSSASISTSSETRSSETKIKWSFDLRNFFKGIHDTFLAENAPLPINISHHHHESLRTKTQALMAIFQGTEISLDELLHVFDDAYAELFDLIYNDPFQRYLAAGGTTPKQQVRHTSSSPSLAPAPSPTVGTRQPSRLTLEPIELKALEGSKPDLQIEGSNPDLRVST